MSMTDGRDCFGCGVLDTGILPRVIGSSFLGFANVKTSPKPGAALSRSVNGPTPHLSSIVFKIDVWSIVPDFARKTVPGAILGEINNAGIRTPNRVKSKLHSPTESSGGTAPHGGGTWSKLPPCSS